MGRKKHLRINDCFCERFSKDGWLECPECDHSYHPKCIGFAEGEAKGSNKKYSCPVCCKSVGVKYRKTTRLMDDPKTFSPEELETIRERAAKLVEAATSAREESETVVDKENQVSDQATECESRASSTDTSTQLVIAPEDGSSDQNSATSGQAIEASGAESSATSNAENSAPSDPQPGSSRASRSRSIRRRTTVVRISSDEDSSDSSTTGNPSSQQIVVPQARRTGQRGPSKRLTSPPKPGYYYVDKILLHQRKRDGTREFLIDWLDYPNETSWEPEANLDGCISLLKEYLQRHKLADTSVKPRAGAVNLPGDGKDSCETANWVEAEEILALVRQYFSNPTYGANIPVLQFENKLGREDAIYLHIYCCHAFVFVHLPFKKTCLIADGGNLYLDKPSVQRDIKTLLPVDKHIGLRFNQQARIDHCGSTAAAIILEAKRLYKNGVWPNQISVPSGMLQSFVRRLHKLPSERIPSRDARYVIKLPHCDKCGKSWRKKSRYNLEKHVRACKGV